VQYYEYSAETYDLYSATWPAGEWTRLTQTTAANEYNPVPTPDGRSVVFGRGVPDARIVSVNVSRTLSLMASE
jgi:Tol biopolymer transport system component